ncbi:MAG TPA: hypothetical protein H9881_18455, partial [Candidatus Stackebrandtia excrementipullorum]|nr:hypothetical protein [Candidatus Stackebrandtia excrementipullorum]
TRWALTGWKVMAELPNPVNFHAASAYITSSDVAERFVCGPRVEPYVSGVRDHVAAGYDHVVLMNAGPDPDGFLDFFAAELSEPLRAPG